MLLDVGHADINRPAEDGHTPLMSALKNGDEDMIDLLLEHNAQVFGGQNVVEMAQQHGQWELAERLEKAGQDQELAWLKGV